MIISQLCLGYKRMRLAMLHFVIHFLSEIKTKGGNERDIILIISHNKLQIGFNYSFLLSPFKILKICSLCACKLCTPQCVCGVILDENRILCMYLKSLRQTNIFESVYDGQWIFKLNFKVRFF